MAQASRKPILVDMGLIECDFGGLEGKSIRETMREHGITAMEELATILPPDGEPWPEVSKRSLGCVGRWLDRRPQANILFVCHDAVMQSMSEALCRCWFDNRHGVPFRFNRNATGWTVNEI